MSDPNQNTSPNSVPSSNVNDNPLGTLPSAPNNQNSPGTEGQDSSITPLYSPPSDTILPTATPQKADDDNSSSQSQMSAVVNSPHVPKKYGGKKVIATIFGVLLLIGGVATGVFLVQRQQLLEQEATSGAECQQAPDCILLDDAANSGSFTAPQPIRLVKITNQSVYEYQPGDTNDGCYHVIINGNSLSWDKVGSGPGCKDVSNVHVWLGAGEESPTLTPSPTPTETEGTPTPTLPAGITAHCNDIKVYDLQWSPFSSDDLSKLKAGDIVRFAVSGTASSGTFDKARFTINGGQQPEVTTNKPGTSEFYDQYTVPAEVSTFNVSAQVHHVDLGWF